MQPKMKVQMQIDNLKLYVENLKGYIRGEIQDVESLDLDLQSNTNGNMVYTELYNKSQASLKTLDIKEPQLHQPINVRKKFRKNLTMLPQMKQTKSSTINSSQIDVALMSTCFKPTNTLPKEGSRLVSQNSPCAGKLVSLTDCGRKNKGDKTNQEMGYPILNSYP